MKQNVKVRNHKTSKYGVKDAYFFWWIVIILDGVWIMHTGWEIKVRTKIKVS